MSAVMRAVMREVALSASGVCGGYTGAVDVVHAVDAALEAGDFVGVIGPNGSGKSTLLHMMSGLHPLRSGRVELLGRNLAMYSRRELASRIAVLPQHPEAPPGCTVEELVWHGRVPRVERRASSEADSVAVEKTLLRCGLGGLRDRQVSRLSGGQRQRAWVAMAVVREPDVLLLDEPLSFLDINHQFEMLALFKSLAREQGIAVAVVLHDLALAFQYCSRLVLFNHGRVVATGVPSCPGMLRAVERVFSVRSVSVPNGVPSVWAQARGSG